MPRNDAKSLTIRGRMGLIFARHSQSEVARRTSTSRQNVSRYASGGKIPLQFAEALTRELGVNPAWLVAGEGTPWLAEVGQDISRTTDDLLELVRAMRTAERMRLGALSGRGHARALRELNDSLKEYRELRVRLKERTRPVFARLVDDLGNLLAEGRQVPAASVMRASELIEAGVQVSELCQDQQLAREFNILRSYYEGAHGDVAKAELLQREVLLSHLVGAGIHSDDEFRDIYNFAFMQRAGGRMDSVLRVCRAAVALAPPESRRWPHRHLLDAFLGSAETERGRLRSGMRRLQRALPRLDADFRPTMEANYGLAQLYSGLIEFDRACASVPDSRQKARLLLSFACFREDATALTLARQALIGTGPNMVPEGSPWALLSAGLAGDARDAMQQIQQYQWPRVQPPEMQVALRMIKSTFSAQIALFSRSRRGIGLVAEAEAARKLLPRGFLIDLLTPAIHFRNVLRVTGQGSKASFGNARRRALSFFRRHVALGYECFRSCLP